MMNATCFLCPALLSLLVKWGSQPAHCDLPEWSTERQAESRSEPVKMHFLFLNSFSLSSTALPFPSPLQLSPRPVAVCLKPDPSIPFPVTGSICGHSSFAFFKGTKCTEHKKKSSIGSPRSSLQFCLAEKAFPAQLFPPAISSLML